MKYFCDKYGKECPHTNTVSQSYLCEAWDPRDFMADKNCRHGQRVDNIEKAQAQWLERNQLRAIPKRKPIETPEQPQTDAAKQELILQRLELMQRKTAAAEKLAAVAERIAETFEKVEAEIRDIADHFGLQMAKIIDTLEPVARMFGDDEEGNE